MELIITIIHLIISVFLIAVVLLQSGKSSGLSGVISGSSDTFLSKNKKKSWDSRMARMTKWMAVAFAVTTLILTIIL